MNGKATEIEAATIELKKTMSAYNSFVAFLRDAIFSGYMVDYIDCEKEREHFFKKLWNEK